MFQFFHSKVIFTSDNPRTEPIDRIIAELNEGVQSQNTAKVVSISDRREAIKTACMFAKSGDIILIAGKGHETYQEINGKRNHFNDKEEVSKAFATLYN